jgi:hypothetical protein
MSLDSWEERFESALNSIPENQRLKAGAILSTIPSREEWECFVATMRDAWQSRDWACAMHPACLVILYDGVGFFEFRSGAFWDGFAAVVNAAVPLNLQTTINHLFAQAAGRFKLPVTQGSYVSSGCWPHWHPAIDVGRVFAGLRVGAMDREMGRAERGGLAGFDNASPGRT